MGALPKRKTQQSRRNRRRSHLAIKAMQLVLCPQCKEAMRPHHICLNCGTYNGREVIEVEEVKNK
jgi:large subunit ribosomal protein L32